MAKGIRYIVKVRKHQDRMGNTYHNARVRDTRLGRYYVTGVTYGYGRQYEVTINNMLKKKRIRTPMTWRNSDIDVVQVRSKKALKFD